jgi:hypothetical protein
MDRRKVIETAPAELLVKAAETELKRSLTDNEKVEVLAGAQVVGGKIVCSSQGGKVSEARK